MTDFVLPTDFITDRAVRNLITQWRNCHLRHRVCRQRVNWRNAKATRIEKQRRKEKWQLVARVLEIENTLLAWAAKATHHPDLWQSKRADTPESTLRVLYRRYYRNRSAAHHSRYTERTALRAKRMQLVRKIRAIRRAWLCAIFSAVYPTTAVPAPLPLHPTELIPRKIKHANLEIRRLVAA